MYQKNMLLALTGAVIAALIIMLINWKYKKDFWFDMKAEFTLDKNDHALGEVELSRMMGKK